MRVFGCDGSGSTSKIVAGLDWIVSHHSSGNAADNRSRVDASPRPTWPSSSIQSMNSIAVAGLALVARLFVPAVRDRVDPDRIIEVVTGLEHVFDQPEIREILEGPQTGTAGDLRRRP